MTEERRKEGMILLEQCEERIANCKRMMIEAHKEGDVEGEWMAMASVRENERFKKRLQNDLGVTEEKS